MNGMKSFGTQWSSGSTQWSGAGLRADALSEAYQFHLRNELPAAISKYVQSCIERPNRARAFHDLGVAFVDASLGLTAVPYLLRAHRLQPEDASYLNDIVFAYLRSARLERAEALISHAARFLPQGEQRCASLKLALERARSGQPVAAWGLDVPKVRGPGDEPADAPVGLAIATPAHMRYQTNFARLSEQYEAAFDAGDAFTLKGILDEIKIMLDADPDWGEGLHMYGLGRMLLGFVADGGSAMERAVELLPGRHDLWDHLAQARKQQEDFDGMRDAFEESLSLNPNRAESWNNAADASLELGRPVEAYQYALQALRLAPEMVQAYFNLARASNELGSVDAAIGLYRKVLELEPEFYRAWNELGSLHLTLGDHPQAIHCYEKVLEVSPDNAGALSCLLFSHNYMGSEDASALFSRAQRFGELLGAQPDRDWSGVERMADRPLRIGFVSGDFHGHPVGKFFCTVVEQLSRSNRVELHAYPTSRANDAWTERIRACFKVWHPLIGLHVEEAEAVVLDDKIDILVDLSGHTAKHRLWLFARKPAPIQVTWLGYFGTTGVKAIDYLLAGPWDVPKDEERWFTERIWRLPYTRLCFSAPMAKARVAALPLKSQGRICFGCFNNIRKLNDEVIRLWGRILAALPDSILFLKNRPLESEPVRKNLLERFAQVGIAADRLVMEPASDYESYLDSYGLVDIALDPFPYTGGTTTIESLWMGVPVITLKGDRLLSRQGESMLMALGLGDWVASSEDEYFEKAVSFARDATALADLRGGLRSRLESSPLMDSRRFANDLEGVFRGMWYQWLKESA